MDFVAERTAAHGPKGADAELAESEGAEGLRPVT